MKRQTMILIMTVMSVIIGYSNSSVANMAFSSSDDTRFARQATLHGGAKKLDISSEPEYLDGVAIDTRIIPTTHGPFAFEGRGAGFTARFSNQLDQFVVEEDNYFIEYRLLGGETGLLQQTDRSLNYLRALPSTDIRYEVIPGGVKEDIILLDADAPTEFRFEVIHPGLSGTLTEDGEIWFQDQWGESVFILPAPFALDSSPEKEAGEAWYDLDMSGTQTIITVHVDGAWVGAPERVFPIVVDPTTIYANSGAGGHKSFTFEIPFSQTFDYTYSVYGHSSLFTTDCGYFEIYNPSRVLRAYHAICGNRSASGSGVVDVDPTEIGTWSVHLGGTNSYSGASGSVTYHSVQAPEDVDTGTRTPDSIEWTWTDLNENETGYRLYETRTDDIIISADPDTVSVTESGLTRGTRYSREIAAYREYDAEVDIARAKPIVQWTRPYTGYQYDAASAWSAGSLTNVVIDGDALVLDQIHTTMTSTWVDEFDGPHMEAGYSYGGDLGDYEEYDDETGETWTEGCGEAGPWYTQNTYVYSGTRAASSESLYCSGGYSFMSRTFENVSGVHFWYRDDTSGSSFKINDDDHVLNHSSTWTQFSQTLTPGTHTFYWNYSGNWGSLYIDELEVDHEWIETTYQPSGTWERIIESFDQKKSRWYLDSVDDFTPGGTSVAYEYSTSLDEATWSAWETDIADVPPGRYLKVRITLSTTDEDETPIVNGLIVFSHSDFTPPTVPGQPSVKDELEQIVELTSTTLPTWTWENSIDDEDANGDGIIRTYYICVFLEGSVCEDWIDTGGSEPSWTHIPSKPLMKGMTYHAIVKAEDFVENVSPESLPGTIKVVEETDPPVMETAPWPDAFSPAEKTTIVWTWSPASDDSDITGYFIKVVRVENGVETDVIVERDLGASHHTTTVLPGPSNFEETVAYRAYVRAVDEWGNLGVWSPPGSIEIKFTKPIVLPPVPSEPDLTEKRVIEWSWDPEDETIPINEYFIKIGTSIDSEGNVTDEIVAERSTNTIRTFTYRMPDSGTYYAQVRAKHQGLPSFTGDWSEPSSIEISPDTTNPTKPGTPTTGSEYTSHHQPVWTWDASTDASGIQSYAIQIRVEESDKLIDTWFDVPLEGGTTVSWADYGDVELEVGRRHFAKVKAKDWADRESEWSSEGEVYIVYTDFESEIAHALTASTAPSAQYTLDTNSPVAALVHGMREAINPVSGALTYAERDLALPGRGGFDLVLDRYYFSSVATLHRMAATARSDEIIAELRGDTHLDDVWGLGVGWSFAFPSIEVLTEGQTSASYLHMGDGRVFRIRSSLSGSGSNLEGYVLDDLRYASDTGLTVNGVQSTHSLRLKDGTKYYFGSVATNRTRLVGIVNRYGDQIGFHYDTIHGRTRLVEIRDTANRRVQFTYNNGLLVLVKYGEDTSEVKARSVSYEYASTSIIGKNKLIKVKRAPGQPEEQQVTYTYNEVDAEFTFSDGWSGTSSANNIYLTLTEATLPSGGRLAYEYGVSTKYIGGDGHFEYPRVIRRVEVDIESNPSDRDVNERSFAYSSPHHDGYPSEGPQLASSYTYWTELTDALGTTEKLTFNWRHQMIEKETSNTHISPAYKQRTEIVYDPDHELPTKETVTPFTDGVYEGSPEVTHKRHDKYGNLLTSLTHGAMALTIYHPDYHVPEWQIIKQNDDAYLFAEHTIDSFGNVIKTESSRVDLSGGTDVSVREGPRSPGISRYNMEWRHTIPGIVQNYIEIETSWVATSIWKTLHYAVYYREVGADEWIHRRTYGTYQGGLIHDSLGTNTTLIDVPEPGIYEVRVRVINASGYSNVVVTGLTYDEVFNIKGDTQTTEYEYDSTYPVNMTLRKLIEKSGGVDQVVRYEYSDHTTDITQVLSGEDYTGVYRVKECVGTCDENHTLPEQRWKYDSFGQPVENTDGLGYVTEYTYDALGRLTETTYADQSSQTIEYDNTTHRSTTIKEPHHTESNPNSTRYQFDSLGRLVLEERLTPPAPGVWTPVSSVKYDAVGNTASRTDARGNVTEYTYDILRRPKRITYPDTTMTRYIYDDGARKQVMTDTNGHQTDQTFDVFGRLIEVVKRPDLGTTIKTEYTYDDAGNTLSTKVGDTRLYEFEYGLDNRLTKTSYPSGILDDVEYMYWNSGELHQRKVDSVLSGQTIDEAGRVVEVHYNPKYCGSEDCDPKDYTEFKYDKANNVTEARTYENGHLKTEWTYTYDPRHRLTSGELTVYTGSAEKTRMMSLEYDDFGNRTSITLGQSGQPEESETFQFAYDAWNRPKSVYRQKEPQDEWILGKEDNRGIWFDNAGNLTRLEYGHSPTMVVTRIPDNRNRVSQIAASPHMTLNYAYDGEGNVLAINSDTFDYDGMDRLTTFTQNFITTTYGYDDRDNRTHQNGIATWDYNDANVLTGISGSPVLWDTRGNTTVKPHAGGELTFTYDDADRLKTVEQGGAVVLENTYDAFGNRVRKVEGDRQTIYLYDGNNVVYEWESDIEGVTTPTDETETFHVIVGNLRVARIVDGDLQFLITDHLGSTRVITDETGNLLHRLDYRPFGEELTASGTDGAKFTGKTEDRIGLYYYGARFYDPTIGRFLTVDPARDGLNWYVYTYNNPLRYVDPDGTRALEYGFVVSPNPLARQRIISEVHSKVYGSLSFGRGMYDFTSWEIQSGRLIDSGERPRGSRWWNYMNESVVADMLAAAEGLYPKDPDVALWIDAFEKKDQRSWWGAYNNSISVAAASEEAKEFFALETRSERRFAKAAIYRMEVAGLINISSDNNTLEEIVTWTYPINYPSPWYHPANFRNYGLELLPY